MAESLESRVTESIRRVLGECGRSARVTFKNRRDGMLDVTVVSTSFEGLPSDERERIIWPALRTFDPEEAVRLTYCLLLSPDEEAEFNRPATTAPGDPDREIAARKDSY